MSSHTIFILIAGALFVHGIGHTLGYWMPARSFPLLNLPESTLKLVGGIVWTLVAVGFIIASMSFYGLFFPAQWWRPLALVFAVVSMLGLVLFGRNWPVFNFIGAFGFDIVVLVALLWLHWPPISMFNR
jgi:hypothetical protein